MRTKLPPVVPTVFGQSAGTERFVIQESKRWFRDLFKLGSASESWGRSMERSRRAALIIRRIFSCHRAFEAKNAARTLKFAIRDRRCVADVAIASNL